MGNSTAEKCLKNALPVNNSYFYSKEYLKDYYLNNRKGKNALFQQ